MTLMNVGLGLVLVAMLAIVPIGCIMTRQKKTDTPQPTNPA
jgi:hypothetical protein